MTLANIPLLIDVLAHIELDPKSWDQRHWAVLYDALPTSFAEEARQPAITTDCLTSFCIAGWTCQLAGKKFVWEYHRSRRAWYAEFIVPTDGAREDETVAVAAARLLGLDEQYQGPAYFLLFDTSNTKADLYRLSAEHAGLEVEDLRARVQARITELWTQTPRT